MMEKPKDSKEVGNSENGENEKSEEYRNFENAAKIIFRHRQEEKIPKNPVPKDLNERKGK